MVNSKASGVLDRSFLGLAHPIRREIVIRLARGPATVGEATTGFAVSRPAISKHLKTLEAAGIVSRERRGRTHWLALRKEPFAAAEEWLHQQRKLCERNFNLVAEHLKEAGEPTDA